MYVTVYEIVFLIMRGKAKQSKASKRDTVIHGKPRT